MNRQGWRERPGDRFPMWKIIIFGSLVIIGHMGYVRTTFR